ncbi:hypothetical protein RJ639_025831 [Escallonia herrerae]|uniref:Uncharacterized protein n=1 Tax=Escallonia herrerae TaxID=1293975 RepID=A0AA88UTH8_9ASTE|nr:hypothetical protein RJ639_025831 [Escallonia herrerae]
MQFDKSRYWILENSTELDNSLLSTANESVPRILKRRSLMRSENVILAGWKLWPFAHLITYGVVPVEQRLLWVDSVELIWVTILSTYSNEKSEARISEVSVEAKSGSSSSSGPEIDSTLPIRTEVSSTLL